MDELDKPGMARPMYWSMHDYADLSRGGPSDKPLQNFPYVKHFVRQIRDRYGERRRIELTEQGVLLKVRDTKGYVDGNADRQRYYAKRYTKLRGVDRMISLVAYYTFFGQPTFDSALVEPVDSVRTLRGKTHDNPEYYRAAYCVLAKRPNDRCTAPGRGAE